MGLRGTVAVEQAGHDSDSARAGRRRELLAFLVLAVLIWPVLAVGFVGAYGFLVWMWQIVFGPPGPPS
jgi:periplasmic nitrate reductase NapE